MVNFRFREAGEGLFFFVPIRRSQNRHEIAGGILGYFSTVSVWVSLHERNASTPRHPPQNCRAARRARRPPPIASYLKRKSGACPLPFVRVSNDRNLGYRLLSQEGGTTPHHRAIGCRRIAQGRTACARPG